MSAQSDAAKARIEGDKGFAERLTQHFESQTDLFAFCPLCKAKINGTKQQIMEHRCNK